jgi:hypothetical protein
MSRNCKLCIAVIFGFFVFGQISVFAQTPTTDDSAFCASISICGSAPKEFTMLLEFSQEMLNAIKTVWTEWTYLGKYVNPNWFVGDKFSPPDMGIAWKAATSLAQKLDFLLATTAVFTSPEQWWGVQDIFAGILTLFKNKVFSRDLQQIQKLDADVTQKRYELWLGGGRTKVVSADNVKKFQKIVQLYKDKWLLAHGFVFPSTLTYADITTVVAKTDSALKSFLSLNTTGQLTSLRWNGSVLFTSETLQSMARQYDCARWTKNMCDTTYKNFAKNMKKIGSGLVDKVKKDIKIFGDAGTRLTQIFSNDTSYKAREEELLNAYYGNKKMTKWGIQINTWAMLTQWRSIIFDDESKTTSTIDQTKNADAVAQVSSVSPISQDAFAQWMVNGMSTFVADQKRDYSLINFAEVKDFSQYFDQLWQKLLAIKNIIWNKDKTDSLMYIIWPACELQCGWWVTKKCWSK